MSTNENKLGKAYELLQPAMKGFTSSATANLRDDNYTKEDIANAQTLYNKITGTPIEEILGMSVEEYNIMSAQKRAKQLAENEAMAKLHREQSVWLDNKPKTAEHVAKFLARGIEVAAGHNFFDDDYETRGTIGVRVDSFIDTLELAQALIKLGVIVIKEDN